MAGAAFGRKGADNGEIAQRRATFLAEERARVRPSSHEAPVASSAAPTASRPIFIREKSMGMAYLFWFILGGLGAHRFYLGFPTSGAIQAATWFGSWLLIATGFFPAIVTLLGGGVWVLVDAFLIPGLHARANARTREAAVAYAFG